MKANQIISNVSLIRVHNNGTFSSINSWIITNHRGWYTLTGYGYTALSLKGLSSIVSRKTGRKMVISPM